jgi:hypothetical protein
MGILKDIVDTVAGAVTFVGKVVGAVVGLAVKWVYKGMAVLLDIVLPKKKALRVARFVTTLGIGVGAGWLFYWGYQLLRPAAAAVAAAGVAIRKKLTPGVIGRFFGGQALGNTWVIGSLIAAPAIFRWVYGTVATITTLELTTWAWKQAR